MTQLFAAFITLTAMAMAAVAAWDRGGTAIDKSLLVALSIAICLGAQLIPALSKRRLAWLLWSGCLVGTIYGHVTFFTHASLRAMEVRAKSSPLVVSTGHQMEAAHEALAGIKSRQVAVVAADLANAHDWRQRVALQAEITEARRAATLHDELVSLAGVATTAEVTAGDDPVTARLALVTGSSEAEIMLLSGLGFSILLELMGAFLWYEVLARRSENIAATVTRIQVASDDDSVTPITIADLRAAIEAGKCRATVSGIRTFLGCSQSRAMELRREL